MKNKYRYYLVSVLKSNKTQDQYEEKAVDMARARRRGFHTGKWTVKRIGARPNSITFRVRFELDFAK